MRFSIILATYNRKAALARTLPTIFEQDFPPDEYEVVVVVDGSTDGTLELVRGMRPGCGLRVLEQPNYGKTVALNAGVKVARGDYILFWDDDLLCEPGLIKEHMAGHCGAEPVVLVGPILVAPDSRRTLETDWMRMVLDRYFERLGQCAEPEWPGHACLGPNCSAARATLLACGGYDESFHRLEDIELGLRVWTKGIKFRYWPAALSYHLTFKSHKEIESDAERDGASMVHLARKHPEYRRVFPLLALTVPPWWKRFAWQMAMRSPLSPASVLTAAFRVADKMKANGFFRQQGLRLLAWRQMVANLRGARREAGSWEVLRREFGIRLPVLLYHRVSPDRPRVFTELTVSPERFEQHVRWLARRGYAGICPADWLAWRREGKPLPPKPVLFTFDDAYEDTAEYALPVLRRFGFGAVVFAITGMLGATNPWGEGRLMTPEQIRHWDARGIEFGAHGRTHRDLTTLAASELSDEVAGSAQDLTALLGKRPVSFAYPFGAYNEAARRCAESAFDLAFSCDEGLNDICTDPHLVRRTMVQPGDFLVDIESRVRLGWSPIERARRRLRLRTRLTRVSKSVRSIYPR